MKVKYYTIFVFLFIGLLSNAQFRVAGTVYDKESNESLIGASVIIKGTTLVVDLPKKTANDFCYYS